MQSPIFSSAKDRSPIRCGYVDGFWLHASPVEPDRRMRHRAVGGIEPGRSAMTPGGMNGATNGARVDSAPEAGASEAAVRRFRTLVNAFDGVVWEADPTSRSCDFVSGRAEELFGYPVEAWLSQPEFFRLYVHPEDAPRVDATYANASATGREREIDYRAVTADGRELQVHERVRIVHEPDGGRRLQGVLTNTTREHELEAQLRQTRRMATVGRLAGGIAHDFNNVLTVIQGHTQLALEDLNGDNPAKDDLREVQDNARRAASLAQQLLEFTRTQALDPQSMDLNATIARMRRMLERLIGEDIELATDLDPELARIIADAGQLEQVIMNLSLNARDAMPMGGRLLIRTEHVRLDDAAACTAGLSEDVKPGRYVCLTMSDTGHGMDVETREHIFEPFFTTKERGKGTGLGLATVYGIIKQSGGYVAVDSEPGDGATFRIYLPRIDTL